MYFQRNVLNGRNRKLFKASLTQHIATSIVDMKDVKRSGPISIYVQNRDVPVYSNKVILDCDLSATKQVIIQFEFKRCFFENFYVLVNST